MKGKCDIVIPVYNSPDWVMLCVEAAIKSDKSERIKSIILVDDCSDDTTKKCLREIKDKYSNIQVLENEHNLGFVKTCNKGMKVTSAEYIMLLNSDCFLAEDTTHKLVQHMETSKKIGLICPVSNNAANLSIRIPDGLNYIQYDKLLEKKYNGIHFDACTIVGNCMIISRECYQAVGGLDEAYGMGYGEETDYQFQADKRGFSAVVAIDTFVFHKSQMSFGENEVLSERKQKNLELFLTRWGYEYQQCLESYKDNDPVEYILKNITEYDYQEAERYKSILFNEKYLMEVANIDKKYNTSEDDRTTKIAKQNKPVQLVNKALNVLREQGFKAMSKKIVRYLTGKNINNENVYIPNHNTNYVKEKICNFKDLIFIMENQEQVRRVEVLKEELEFNGVYSDAITLDKLNPTFLKCYRGTIFINCTYTESIQDYIQESKKLNKAIFWVMDQNEEYKLINRDEIDDIREMVDGVITNAVPTSSTQNIYVDKVALTMSDIIKPIDISNKKNKGRYVIGYIEGQADSESLNNIVRKLEARGIDTQLKSYNNEAYNESTLNNTDIFIVDKGSNLINIQELWVRNAINGIVTLYSDELEFALDSESRYTTIEQCYELIEGLLRDIKIYERKALANYEVAIELFSTQRQGHKLTQFIKSRMKQNIAFVLPSIVPCGGVNVVIKHCEVLQEAGYDAFIINMGIEEESIISNSREILVVSEQQTCVLGHIDKIVATMWLTNQYIDSMANFNERYYLVQGYETDFYPQNDKNRMLANSTYTMDKVNYVTVSKWCERWLKESFERDVRYVRNGLSTSHFIKKERDFNDKISILVEGDPGSFYKNIDESFRITNKLNPEKFEIVFMSNQAHPKSWYRVDEFYHKVPYDQVVEVYQNADILIKSSVLESFSYPPLEMMSTGGVVVAVQNDGNKEYMQDNVNCLIYKHGDVDGAVELINKVVEEKELREKLIVNGLLTAQDRNWDNIRKEIIEAYM